mgnify:CR=1 FL=1
MDTNQLIGTAIGAGIALSILDRVGNKPKKRRETMHTMKRKNKGIFHGTPKAFKPLCK